MTDRNASGGGLTGATGELTPDEVQRDFEPGELREVSDPLHRGDVTQAQATHAPEHADVTGTHGGPDRDARIGGDERAEGEDRL